MPNINTVPRVAIKKKLQEELRHTDQRTGSWTDLEQFAPSHNESEIQ